MIAAVVSSMLFVLGTLATIYSCFYGYEGFSIRREAYETGKDLGFVRRNDPEWMWDRASFRIGVNRARLSIEYFRDFHAGKRGGEQHPYTKYNFGATWASPLPAGPWFKYEHRGGLPFDPREGQWFIALPGPLVLLLTGMLPGIALYRRVKKRPGCCKNCGYDLRATPDRCPECGSVVSPSNRKQL